jgi:hypothetical protein
MVRASNLKVGLAASVVLGSFTLGALAETLTREEILKVISSVKGILKDPNSAQFGDKIYLARSSGKLTVCGTVNARNSYGGYSGYSPFIVVFEPGTLPDAAVGSIQNNGFENPIVILCRQAGVPI